MDAQNTPAPLADRLLTAALEYAAMGYKVFPVKPGGKEPLTKHGFLDATTNEDQILKWWGQWPEANIGVAVEGYLTLDRDPGSEEWDGNEYDKAASLMAGPVQQTPRGGYHHLFRLPDGVCWRRKIGKAHPGIDVLGEGGYIILAPSEVWGLGKYHWLESNPLEPVERLPYPPQWFCNVVENLHLGTNGALNGSTRKEQTSGANIIPKDTRNTTLFNLAIAMRRVGMPQGEIEAALLKANATRVVPPLDTKEVRTIAWSAAKYEPDQIATAMAENHFEQFVEAAQESEEDAPKKPHAFPEHLLNVGGLMGEFCEYVNATARRLQPVLSLGAAIALMGVITGRKVQDGSGTRTNVYVVNLAESGFGKNVGISACNRILSNLGAEHLLHPNGFHSESSVWTLLSMSPAVLAIIDEFGKYLASTGAAKSGTFLKRVPATWTSLFSQSGENACPPVSADPKKRVMIDQPHLCILGASTQGTFFEGINEEAIENGFLPRLLFFEGSDGRPKLQSGLRQSSPPAALMKRVKSWVEFQPGGNLNQQHPVPHTVGMTERAEALLVEIEEKLHKIEQASKPKVSPIWARCMEMVNKLALLHACSLSDPLQAVIDTPSVQWAWDLMSYQYGKLEWLIEEHLANTEFESSQQRVIRWLRKQPGQRATHSKLLRNVLARFPRRTREDVMGTLIESGKVWSWTEKTKTCPTRMYSINRDDIRRAQGDDSSETSNNSDNSVSEN